MIASNWGTANATLLAPIPGDETASNWGTANATLTFGLYGAVYWDSAEWKPGTLVTYIDGSWE